MEIIEFHKREKMIRLYEDLLSVEEERLHGNIGYSADTVEKMMYSAINEIISDVNVENYKNY